MILNNYYAIRNLVFNNFTEYNPSLYTMGGKHFYSSPSNDGDKSTYYSWLPSSLGIVVGTGDTFPEVSNITLVARTTDVSITPSITTSIVNGKYILNITALVTYTGAEENITIKEIGIYKTVAAGSSIGEFLIVRELLTPYLLVNKNETATISLSLEF
jgi:hypothetical protein